MKVVEYFCLFAFVLFFIFAILRHHPESIMRKPAANSRLENCLQLADYVARGKVASCKKTAELGATASFSFASSFTRCIEEMDKILAINRDACHRKFQD